MAQELVVHGVPVKTRSALGVFLLSTVTFGIYYFVWYYKINRELNDYGLAWLVNATRKAGHGGARFSSNPLRVDAGLAALAVSLGALLIVPPFVSVWRTFARLRRAQELAGVQQPASHAVGFLLFLLALILLPFEVAYAQHHLNRLWKCAADEEQKERLGMRGTAAGN